MLVKLICVESNGENTTATLVLYNESTEEKIVIPENYTFTTRVKKIDVPAGIYRIESYKTYGGIRYDLSDSGYRVNIRANQVNYVGDWFFTEDWNKFVSERGKFSVSFSTSFQKETLKEAVSRYPDLFKSMTFNVSEAIEPN